MAIVLQENRPAIDIIQGSFSRPEEPWAHLGDAGPRMALQRAIPGVGRYAFVAGPGLLLAMFFDDTGRSGTGEDRFVDFGHEVIPAEPVRVRIHEVLYHDEQLEVGLLRANLPVNIEPLRLSVRHPEELIGREVALIGYPGLDAQRNDPDMINRLFRGVFDVKRLLPGRIVGYEFRPGQERPVLVHDCSSTGGCGGAPLIDLETGEVLGLHFAGLYLQANYAVPSWELARNPLFAQHGVIFAGPVPVAASVEKRAQEPAAPMIGASEAPGTRASVADLAGEDVGALSFAPEFKLEAIVLAMGRPALLVEQGRRQQNDLWESILQLHEPRLTLAIRAVGKLCLPESSASLLGTAFMVGERLAMTASFLATEIASGAGRDVTLKPGLRPVIDFGEALGLPPGEATARVIGVPFIHPFFQVALLELDEMPASVAMLDLAAQIPPELADRTIAVVSFAAQDSGGPPEWQEELYQNRWGRLFVQPGKTMQLGQTPGALSVPALVHDCSTIGGSAGAPVFDLDTGYVIGIHTQGKWLEGGYAQPAWELARDPNVWRHAIRFRPDPRPSWLGEWKDPQPASRPVPVHPEPASPPDRWTVDSRPPIEFHRPEVQRLEGLLIQIDAPMALFYAETAGLPPGSVSSSLNGRLLWREIIKKASLAAVLRRLVEAVANDPAYAALAPGLRESL